jgi:hypothetical protein
MTTTPEIQEATAQISQAQQGAMAAALQARDWREVARLGIYPAGAVEVRAAEADLQRALRDLEQARGRLGHLTREQEQADTAARAQATWADQQRRRQWVHSTRPDLLAALEEAEQAERDIKAQRYVFDSPTGQVELAIARRSIQAAKAAIEAAAAQAPAAEVS